MAALVALLLLLILAAPSGAATVTASAQQVCMPRDDCYTAHSVAFTAAAGEINDVTVTQQGQDYRLADAGAPVTAGAGCRPDGDHAAVCTVAQQLQSLRLELLDGDDRAQLIAGAVALGGDGEDALFGGTGIGGPGNDTIGGPGAHEGGEGDDHIFGGGDGGPGDDLVDQSQQAGPAARLGPGKDVYIGSRGDDRIEDAGGEDASRDLIDGGGGRDTLSYEQFAGPIVADLGGGSGQDGLAAIEVVTGTNAADTLIGDPGPNRLDGHGGDDRLIGGGGADQLHGGDGEDRLEGGDGPDVVVGGTGADVLDLGGGDDTAAAADRFYRDEIDCGPGDDLARSDPGDRRSGCERNRLRSRPYVIGRVAPAGGGRHRLHYVGWCGEWPSCRGRSDVSVWWGGGLRTVATVRFSGIANRRLPRSRPFRLPAAARRELRERGVLRFFVRSFVEGGQLAAHDRLRLRDRARKSASDR